MSNLIFSLSLLLLSLLQCTTTLAQSPASPPVPQPSPPVPTASPPVPSGPPNITKILEKASQYTVFLRLLATTQVANQINSQLNDSSNEMTIFAPSDSAFSSLQAGTLNSLSDQEKSELVQFHMIPTFLSISQFQTVSNPLRTQAGDTRAWKFPLNVTTSGSQVNITTGIDNTTVSSTIYTDNQLAVYQVDKVLLPWSIFGPQPPAEAPAPVTPKKKKATAADAPNNADTSGAGSAFVDVNVMVLVMSVVIAVCAGFVS
ncbi:fasciclin-like arabinogalactan protein 12 [Rhododendron vialii]|uniref:fasciclin-like arabinogalactan protein 12 n=1 Tax=Rhododendron vialii TaxID=182163 RepID=UPI00265EB691|nr:fasciclin-like arabinogalactan protein 12 [Rhododendron vialii]